MMMHNHPYHMVTYSPWPILMAFNLMNLLVSILIFMYLGIYLVFYNLIVFFIIYYQWNRDIIRESTFQGFHTNMVLKFLKFSMILFIISELFFFISFFWAYFHVALSPGVEIGMVWPPKMIKYFNPYDIPLLNSIILVSSGFMVTWSHHSLLNNNYKDSLISLMLTIFLGIYFSILQLYEYNEASFTFNDGIYGSIFFLSTGFHGFHIIVGTMMLIVSLFRMWMNHFSIIHHFNFEASLWYWHFVDVIWLFLYIFIYWWMF